MNAIQHASRHLYICEKVGKSVVQQKYTKFQMAL